MNLSDLPPVPWEHVFHLAVVVPDLNRALAEIGRQLGLEFEHPRRLTFQVRDGDGVALPAEGSSDMRYAYSRGSAPHLELIEAKPAGVWSGDGGARVHHVGTWSDDISSDARRLQERGFRIEAIGGLENDEDRFAYLANDFGMRVELVDSRLRAGLEARLQREDV